MSEVMVVVVSAFATSYEAGSEVDPAKFASPAYVAVTLFEPAEVNVRSQVPSATVPVQESAPDATVTSPVGVPEPVTTETE